MGLKSIRTNDKRQVLFDASEPLAVIIERVSHEGVFGSVLGHWPYAPSGTTLRLRGHTPRCSERLTEIALGRGAGEDRIHPTGVGDVVMFANAAVETVDDQLVAFVGHCVARVHDGLKGPVQVVKGLLKPTRHTIGKRGMTQFASIVEPRIARPVASAGDIVAFYETFAESKWPGGEPKILLRNKEGSTEVGLETIGHRREKPEEMGKRIEESGAFSKGAIEALPVWTLPVGRSAQMAEANPTIPTDGPTYGRVSRLYVDDYLLHYRPTIAIVHDEEEWAFGGKTGKVHRVVGAYHPVGSANHVLQDRIPTKPRRCDDPSVHMKFFFPDKDALRQSEERRTKNRGDESVAEMASSTPAPTSLSSLRSSGLSR